MDRAVVVAPARRALSLEDRRDGLRETAAKIRKVTTPDVIPEDVIPPQVRGRSVESQKSRLLAEKIPTKRAGPYSGRPRPLAITDRSLEPPLQPPVAPPPPAAVLPTNEHREADYAQLREASHARTASAAPSHASAASGYRSRSRGRGHDSEYQIVPWKPRSAPSPAPSGRPPSEEVGRTPASSVAASHRSASQHTESAGAPSRSASQMTAASRVSSASRVSQRSSVSRFHSRSPRRPDMSVAPVLQPATRARSASVGMTRESSSHPSEDFGRGNTPDKRFKGALGEVRRVPRARGRQRAQSLLNETRNRD